ncbi:MAG TPA: SDR family oxidoreductase [Gemmatimonadaceae bacterium]|nr:SDR family oxidoreductase [Gemmatimonadaceae bacterium]
MAKTWFITGSNSGIGRAVAEQLLVAGQRVAATARRPETLIELADRFGEQVWTARLDVTDTDQIRAVVERAFAELGRIDVIFSNAGYGLTGAAEELSDEELAGALDTNLIGPIQLARAVLPHLRAQQGGRFLQLSSVGGQISDPGMSPYAAAKWGIEGFMQALKGEISEFGIEVTLIEPGNVPTDFGANHRFPTPMAEYESGPVGRLRRFIQTPGAVNAAAQSDLRKVASAIIAVADQTPGPTRVALGPDAYDYIHDALTTRIAELESLKDICCGVAVDGPKPVANWR